MHGGIGGIQAAEARLLDVGHRELEGGAGSPPPPILPTALAHFAAFYL